MLDSVSCLSVAVISVPAGQWVRSSEEDIYQPNFCFQHIHRKLKVPDTSVILLLLFYFYLKKEDICDLTGWFQRKIHAKVPDFTKTN